MNPSRGIAFKIIAVLCFTGLSALVRFVGTRVPAAEAVAFRSAFTLIPLLIWLAFEGQITDAVRTRQPFSHFFRGLTGIFAMLCAFTGLALLPLAEVTAIGFAMPLFSVIFAAMFLGERVHLFRLSAVSVGFIGVLIILWPRFAGHDSLSSEAAFGALAALLGAIFSASAVVQIRRLTRTETTPAIVFYFSLYSTALTLLTLPLGWVWPSQAWAWPETSVLVALVSTGLLGGVGQIMMTQSYRYADASLLAPFDYTAIVWASIAGWLLFQEIPGQMVFLGTGIVVLAGLVVIWRERRLGLERGRELEVTTPE